MKTETPNTHSTEKKKKKPTFFCWLSEERAWDVYLDIPSRLAASAIYLELWRLIEAALWNLQGKEDDGIKDKLNPGRALQLF